MGTKHGNATHGMSRTHIYNIWKGMRYRCYNKQNHAYVNYGGRGIGVSRDWLDFNNFYRNMGKSYKYGLTIERIDNNGDYCLANCKWIPRSEQNKNTRRKKLITYNGMSKTITDWAKYLGINKSTIDQRYYVYKWDIPQCLEGRHFGHN